MFAEYKPLWYSLLAIHYSLIGPFGRVFVKRRTKTVVNLQYTKSKDFYPYRLHLSYIVPSNKIEAIFAPLYKKDPNKGLSINDVTMTAPKRLII